MRKKWLIHPESQLVRQLADELNISAITAQILINRGINNPAQAQVFLQPKLINLSDPFEIPNIKQAAERVLLAKERGEKVLIFGDYDVDGVTGTAILLQTLKFLGLAPLHYIPHRYDEGYSLSLEAVEKIAADGVKLIITVDCGTSNFTEITRARELGMEVVVTDHHNLSRQVLPAAAIVNPKFMAQDHPARNLAGAGVAFKFAWALLRTAGIKESAFLASLLDLAALGTIADIVPLAEENRIIAVRGLAQLNQRQRVGLRHLSDVAGLPERVTVEHVSFSLAPRINAAGRLEHANKALELMLTADESQAQELAGELNSINIKRQDIGSGIKSAVFGQLTDHIMEDEPLIVLSGDNWHPGVIGIVASQVVDRFSRPTILIGVYDEVGRGSARSLAGINIYNLLNSCSDLFETFGGHAGAAGFEIKTDKLTELTSRLKEAAQISLAPEALIPKLMIDMELPTQTLTLTLAKKLEIFAPHGEGNPQPLFLSRQLRLIDQRTVGRDNRHLKLKLSDGIAHLDTIGFDCGHLAGQLVANACYDVVYRLESNEWNGFENVQLNLADIREAKS
ncbi:single-stranded-DNA-specific exonuclease RecJ [Candidatus Saganbacteria bacterium]|nr:single-stranded-DNA-specific exonuclease RecJ [Candidatus Saganbacteria bacterium]